MNINTIGLLTYAVVAVIAAIISATIMRAKMSNWDSFDIGDAFPCLLFGAWWPITIVAGIVYMASDFLVCKIYKKDNWK